MEIGFRNCRKQAAKQFYRGGRDTQSLSAVKPGQHRVSQDGSRRIDDRSAVREARP